MNILEMIIFGFYFGVGAICAWIGFQLIIFVARELYIKHALKKIYTKKQTPKKPSGMEFGKFND